MPKLRDILRAQNAIRQSEVCLMQVIIDRFEGNFAVVELPDKRTANIDKQLIPSGAKEGTTLSIDIKIDKEATESRHKRISGLMNSLFKD